MIPPACKKKQRKGGVLEKYFKNTMVLLALDRCLSSSPGHLPPFNLRIFPLHPWTDTHLLCPWRRDCGAGPITAQSPQLHQNGAVTGLIAACTAGLREEAKERWGFRKVFQKLQLRCFRPIAVFPPLQATSVLSTRVSSPSVRGSILTSSAHGSGIAALA